MNKCPHCGSTDGYYVRYTSRTEQLFDWVTNDAYSHEYLSSKDYSKPRCIECRKIVPIETEGD